MADITMFFYPWQNFIYFILFVLAILIIIIFHIVLNISLLFPSILTAIKLSKKNISRILKLIIIITVSIINSILICYLYIVAIFPALSMKCRTGAECGTLGLIVLFFVAPFGLCTLTLNILRVFRKNTK